MRSDFYGVFRFLGRQPRYLATFYVVGVELIFAMVTLAIVADVFAIPQQLVSFKAAIVVTLVVAAPITLLVQNLVTELQQSKRMLKALVKEVVVARDEALRANRFKSQFLANLSHELRTPLNSIIGFSQLLQRQAFGPLGDARYLSYIEDINLGGQHLLDLINDILALSKIESGTAQLEEGAEANVDEVISDAMHLLMPLAEQRNVSLAYSGMMADSNLMISERMLRQIILNILSNAVKFTEPDGFVRVSIEHRVNGDLGILVHDTGIGMSSEDIEIAMTPFGQISKQMSGSRFEQGTSLEQGTGLGLPLVKAMMDLQKAMLRIDSVPNDGTIVRLIFPAERVVSASTLRHANSH